MKQESDVIERFDTVLQALQKDTEDQVSEHIDQLILAAAILTLAEVLRARK